MVQAPAKALPVRKKGKLQLGSRRRDPSFGVSMCNRERNICVGVNHFQIGHRSCIIVAKVIFCIKNGTFLRAAYLVVEQSESVEINGLNFSGNYLTGLALQIWTKP